MLNLRVFLGLILAAAVANYGVLATSTAHAHDHDGPHKLHVAAAFVNDQHDHDHGHEGHHDHDSAPGSADARANDALPDRDSIAFSPEGLKDEPPAEPGHAETGFHTHSAPQMGSQNAIALADLSPPAERIKAPPADKVRPQGGERPPFRPPRFFL